MKITKECHILVTEKGQTNLATCKVVDKGDFYLVPIEYSRLTTGAEILTKALRVHKSAFQETSGLPDGVTLVLNHPINLDTLRFENVEIDAQIVSVDPENFDPTA
jgi:hypothetical protein